jgi:HEXXH motif-containing protein
MVGVGNLSGSDGAEVLHDLAPGAGEPEEARELAEHLGGLPLALNLAGSYLARALDDPWPMPSTPETFDEYRASFDSRLADMAFDPDTDLGPDERNRRAIASTWELSLDLLHRQGTDLARPLLRLLSALGPAPVPYRELIAPEVLAGSELFTAPTAERLQEAVKGLAGLQLITIETTRESAGAKGRPQRWITIHPMVRAACRAHADFTTQTPLLLRLVTALLERHTGPLDPFDTKDWPRWQAVAPHCAAVLSLLPEDDRVDPDLAVAATEPAVRTAQYRTDLGMYREASAELEALGSVRARLLGDDHPATIAAALHRAWAVRHTGALVEADQLYQDVGRACARALPDGHAHLQSAKTGRARVLRELGRYESAEEELRTALAMRLRARTYPRGILRIRHELAILAHKRDRHEEAVAELRSLSREFTELVGEDNLDTLANWVTLARALREAGHATEAQEAVENALRGYLKVLGPEHPDVMMARHERARLIRDHESDPACVKRARDEFDDIWQFNERHLGSGHPDTLAARHELATTWHLLGRPDMAVEHYEAVLEAGSRRLGGQHPDVLRCARNLAGVRAELAERTVAPGGETDGDGDEAALRGGQPMDDNRPADQDVRAPDPDLANLSLEQALTSPSHTAAARLVGRYVRPRVNRSGEGGGGGGYSSSSYSGSGGRPVSYTPAPAARVPQRDLTEDVVTPPFPTSADLRTMAAGAEDAVLAQRLRAQQRGARAVVLDELLDLTAVITPSDETGSLRVPEVRELLVRAERADPSAVTAVLLHPSVGRWLGRALRALHTPPGGPRAWAGTPSADLLRLHSLAAAVGVRARLSFTLPVPVYDGHVHLPGLGAADLRASGTTLAHVVSLGAAAVVEGEGVEVRLPSRSDPKPPGWISVHRVRTPAGARRDFDLVLEDVDPYRESDEPVPPDPLGPVELTHWRRTIRDAGELLNELRPGQADAVAVALTALTPRTEAEPAADTITSVSSSEAFGGVVLSTPPDAVELAATLVHEFRHMELDAVLDSLDLYETEHEGPDGELYYAPWRDTPRPLPGCLHGVFAFFAVVDFWRELSHVARDGHLRRRAQFQYAYWRIQTGHAFETLSSTARLTASGRELITGLGDRTARWTVPTPVPEEITELATEAAVAHRVRWRLHHVSPDPHAVSKLAEAWRSGAKESGGRGAGVLLPDTTVPSSNQYTAMLCRWATAPDEDTVDDPADLARLQGRQHESRRLATEQVTRRPQQPEHWARLALTLRRDARTASLDTADAVAARALVHCPEVVRATFARIAVQGGPQPDPVALAAWLGAPADLPDLPSMHSF